MRVLTAALGALLVGVVLGVPTTSSYAHMSTSGFGTHSLDSDMLPHNVIMEDGSVKVVYLHKSFRPSNPPSDGRSPALSRRLTFHAGGDTGQCGDSDFTDKTTTGSAYQVDCQVVNSQMQAQPGWFEVKEGVDIPRNGDWARVAYHSTCVFGIKTQSIWGSNIGTQDILDLIKSSMDRRPNQEKMQYEGKMKCQNISGQQMDTFWAIFRPLPGTLSTPAGPSG